MLQVLDDGRLTDSHGNVVDFKNTIIILTSNLGSDLMTQQLPRDTIEIKEEIFSAIREFFRPEFLNRLDEILVFKNLPEETMKEIVKLQINELRTRLREKNISLNVEIEGLEWLAKKGYDPVFGARPLKRLIQKEIQDQLAEGLLSGDLKEGSKSIVFVENDLLQMRKE